MCILVVVFIVLGVQAVEDGSSKREDGGSPSQAVAPVKLMVHPQPDRLYELDGEQDQAAHLEHHCMEKRKEREGTNIKISLTNVKLARGDVEHCND